MTSAIIPTFNKVNGANVRHEDVNPGDTFAVGFRSNGDGKVVKYDKYQYATVHQVFSDGRVRTRTGDVYELKKANMGKGVNLVAVR